MGDAGPREGEIEVSPEEKRFLRRFFRRQAVPWFLAAVVIAITSAWSLRSGQDDTLEVRTSAALAQLRSENQELRSQVALLAKDVRSRAVSTDGADELERRVENARRNVRMIEARVTASLERRLDTLEGRIAAAPAPVSAPAAAMPSDVSAWDASAILERLYAIEMQQGSVGSGEGAGVSSRLVELERRLARVEGPPSSPPAALPAR